MPTPTELADVSDWMQRLLAETSQGSALAVLADRGGTRKIRNIARDRARRGHRPYRSASARLHSANILSRAMRRSGRSGRSAVGS